MISILCDVLSSHQMKKHLLVHHLKKFISVTLKQAISFQAHLSLRTIGCLDISILAPIEHLVEGGNSAVIWNIKRGKK